MPQQFSEALDRVKKQILSTFSSCPPSQWKGKQTQINSEPNKYVDVLDYNITQASTQGIWEDVLSAHF